MKKIERPNTLREKALESLRDGITNYTLKPGDRLVERTLCESMGVSRTVVRECIRHLESERLVVGLPNSGFIVALISDQEVAEIYEIRTLLECSAVRACCDRITANVIERLYELHGKIVNSLKQDDIKMGLKLTTQFYELIFKTAEKHVAWDLVAQLNSRISRLRALTLSSFGRKDSGPQGLFDIIKALEEKDPDKTSEACTNHLKKAYEIAMRLDREAEL